MMLVAGSPDDYLGTDDVVTTQDVAVAELVAKLRAAHLTKVDFACAAYEWVREEIAHSLDAQDRKVTISAAEVLSQGVGLCFAKSHLLVALLRNQGIPAGLCYQRLSDRGGYVLHGLVAVHLDGAWHRIDPRGNRRGVDAQFSLAAERLAWQVDTSKGEIDYPQVYASAVAPVVEALRCASSALALCEDGLPATL